MKVKFLIVVFCVMPNLLRAQTFCERLYYGGNFGLALGDFTDIELSPHVGYYITTRWAAGVGASYEYFNRKIYFLSGGYSRYETHIYGGRLFTEYVLVNNVNDFIPLGLNFRILAHVEYEALSYEKSFFGETEPGRKIVNSILLGGGLRFPTGRRSSMNLLLMWKLNSDYYDVYGYGPIIRIGYNF
ncbi:MAG: hypothetical protein LBF89_05660 [Bacteroidales bacterium]|jgi:hypothetical protein|nr:hypothetical protein [Bacteroidales bacterium]